MRRFQLFSMKYIIYNNLLFNARNEYNLLTLNRGPQTGFAE